jgi:hypothetical protein
MNLVISHFYGEDVDGEEIKLIITAENPYFILPILLYIWNEISA